MTTNLLSATTLKGTNVTNPAGENLGDIKDIMIDYNSGNVAYVVISFGGFLGIGNKLFAVPMEALRVDKASEDIIMDVNKEKLENAPGFDSDNWPTTADREFLTEVHSHYGYKPYWEREHEYRGTGTTTGTGFGTPGSGNL